MNQADLRKLSEERIRDAQALIAGGRWEFAYYSAGYALECALKSCVLARMVFTGLVFREKWDAKECMTHDLFQLIELAGLKDELNAKLKSKGSFVNNWSVVKDWKVTSRYEGRSEVEAMALLEAIRNNPDGVLPWIQMHW